MFEKIDITQLIGIIIGVVSVFLIAGKLLIDDWHKRKLELETLKETNINNALNRFDVEITELKKIRDNFKDEIYSLSTKLTRQDSRIELLGNKIDNAVKEISDLNDKIKSYVRETVRTEVIQLTKELMLVRERKDGKS